MRNPRALVSAFALAAVFSIMAGGCVSQAKEPSPPAATAAVDAVYGEWRDERRQRDVPYKIYLPTERAPRPVVIFSHGLGGSREGADYLLSYLAKHGFVAVAIQHPGTDESLLRDRGAGETMDALSELRKGVRDPRAAIARFGDVRFVLDRLEAENKSGRMAGRFDLSRVGMSGHSYGALTTLVAIGQRVGAQASSPFQDDRIDAAIVYSPNAPRNQDPQTALAGVRTPILHFTGTEDRTPLDLEASPEGRQIPFRTIAGADQFLVVLNGGDHMIFSGRVQRSGGMTPSQQAQTELIERETLLFWRAYLLGDAEALQRLCGLPARVRAIASAEAKASRCVK